MTMTGERGLMIQALEIIGQQWEENQLPQEILLSDQNVNLILTTRELVADPGSGITAELLRSGCPTFVDQLQQATMRNL